MNTIERTPMDAMQRWIGQAIEAGQDRGDLRRALDSLPDVVRETFGIETTLRLVDAPLGGSDATSSATNGSFELRVADEPYALLTPTVPADAEPMLDRLAAFLAQAGALLTLAEEHQASATLTRLWSVLSDPEGDPDAVREALGLLRDATASDAIGIIAYRDGGFALAEVAGTVPDVVQERLASRSPEGTGLLARAYRTGEELFLADAASAATAVDDPTVRGEIGSIAVRPMPRVPHAHRYLVAVRKRTGPWRPGQRSLLHHGARALRLYLERRRQAELLWRILDLERDLLRRDTSEPMQRILDELVDLVPGAEAGTLLVRGEDGFSFAGVRGYAPEPFAQVNLSVEEIQRWYGTGRPTGRLARLLRAPDGIESASRDAAGPKLDGFGELPRILANLALPVEHDGRLAALVNLDAFATPDAFLSEDLELLEKFAPIVGFVLYESGIREELRRLGSHDPLTGLPNRRAFDATLKREVRRVERSESPLALLIMDLDDFKRVNDDHGHAAGDAALQAVAASLRRTVRASDHVFRWGGDEFAALLPDTDAEGAARMVDRLRAAVARLHTPGADLGLTLGVAVKSAGDDLDGDALLTLADREMYAGKQPRPR